VYRTCADVLWTEKERGEEDTLKEFRIILLFMGKGWLFPNAGIIFFPILSFFSWGEEEISDEYLIILVRAGFSIHEISISTPYFIYL